MRLRLSLMPRALTTVLFTALLSSASACGDAQVSLPESLQVISSSPENGSTQVAVDAELLLQFSDELDLDSLDPGAISIRDDQGLVVNAQRLFLSQNKILQFVPTVVLHDQSTYYFLVKEGVSGLHQVSSSTTFQARFTTQ